MNNAPAAPPANFNQYRTIVSLDAVPLLVSTDGYIGIATDENSITKDTTFLIIPADADAVRFVQTWAVSAKTAELILDLLNTSPSIWRADLSFGRSIFGGVFSEPSLITVSDIPEHWLPVVPGRD